MSRFQWLAVALSLFAALPASAQTDDGGQAIVVQGETGKKSDWKRAESDHVIVFSDGSEAELIRVTKDLDRLYLLLSRIFRRGEASDDTVKLQVVLFESPRFQKNMGLANQRWLEGPYFKDFPEQRYYDPREDGPILAVSRTDQLIDLNTAIAADHACEAAVAAGVPCREPQIPPFVRRWESVLFGAYAQHFLLTYTHAIYPRWYIDGVGAMFSTTDVRGDGTIDYARIPEEIDQILYSYGTVRSDDVLTGRYLDKPSNVMLWTPYHAWVIAHYFLFSKLKPEESRQFARYMAAVQRGVPLAKAAEAFGDTGGLRQRLFVYANKRTLYARTAKPSEPVKEPLITRLSRESAALVDARVALGARVNDAEWLDALRIRLAGSGSNDARLLLAEAECRSDHPDACLATAEALLADDPDDVRALAWKGAALTHRAIAGPPATREAGLAAARDTFQRAIALDGQAPLPAIGYFRSFTLAGTRVPESAMIGMARALQHVPGAASARLQFGEELLRQGQNETGYRVLYPLLFDAGNTAEQKTARNLLGGARPSGQP
ncbi:hypothetical protein J2W22_004296 [Sphingomonas kyeonggiensis]|uniref:hypothetical protein n=1 Tax=Sphingomonas kyeonggiensis TaxID=1268553 RepID=UPI00278B5167|nr:hypothetical protein [Sphingomonas kyeonggiensis]MDQ0252208.1 hypothetical protein [Sphingomonas kyeonggiensis]